MARPHVREFLTGFVKPLVTGGQLHIGQPIPQPDLDRWEGELSDASVELMAVDDARHAVLSTLVCRPPPIILDGDDLALAAGLHDALFLVHPRAEIWSVTDKQRRRIVDTALAMVSQPLTRDRSRVLGRHALLHNVFKIRRNDILLTWWTGRARFHGQTPPARLTSWKAVRRVREEITVVGFDDLLGTSHPDTQIITASLLRRSPLTQLIDNYPGAPQLHWEDAVFVLRDAELARAVAYRIVPDAPPRELIAGPARLAAAFEQMLERAPAEADVRAVAAFLVHCNALFCLGELSLREGNAKSPLVAAVLGPDSASQRPRGLATLFALPGALATIDPRLSMPPGVEAMPALANRWMVHRAQARDLLGEAQLDALSQRLKRHLRGGGGSAVDAAATIAIASEPEAEAAP